MGLNFFKNNKDPPKPIQEENTENDSKQDAQIPEDSILSAILTKIKEISDDVNNKITEINERVKAVEEKVDNNTDSDIKKDIEDIHKTLDEFTAVYEMISNQYNPFINKEKNPAIETKNISNPKTEVQTNEKSKIIIEDAITKETSQIDIHPIHPGKIRVDESFNINGNNTPKEIISHVELNPNNPKEISKAIQDMTNINEDMKRDIIDSIIIDKRKEESKKLLKSTSKTFISQGMNPFNNLLDLVMALNKDHSLFNNHVGPRKDHFADWIKNSLKMKSLSNKLREIKERDKYIITILSI